MSVAQVLPIVTLYASIFCPNKQPMGSNGGRDYLQRTGPETWNISCCPPGWRFVHRRCSCVPISGLSGYGHRPGMGMPSFSKGSGNVYLPKNLHGHVGMRPNSGAAIYHTINHNTFQLVDFIKDSYTKQNLNSNRRNTLLLRAHRLKHQNALRQKQLLHRRNFNSDISLDGKQLVYIQHPQYNQKRKQMIVKSRRGKKNNHLGLDKTMQIRQGQNALNMHNSGFPEPSGIQSVLGDTGNTLDGTQWFPDMSGSRSGNSLHVNAGTSSGGVMLTHANTVGTSGNMVNAFPTTESRFGAGRTHSNIGNGNFQNSIGADATLGPIGTINLGDQGMNRMPTDIGVGVNAALGRGGNLNSIMNDVSASNSVNVNANAGIRLANSNGGGQFSNALNSGRNPNSLLNAVSDGAPNSVNFNANAGIGLGNSNAGGQFNNALNSGRNPNSLLNAVSADAPNSVNFNANAGIGLGNSNGGGQFSNALNSRGNPNSLLNAASVGTLNGVNVNANAGIGLGNSNGGGQFSNALNSGGTPNSLLNAVSAGTTNAGIGLGNSNGEGQFINRLQTNGIGVGSLDVNSGAMFSGNIRMDSTNGRHFGLNDGGINTDPFPTDATTAPHSNLNRGVPSSGNGNEFDMGHGGSFKESLATDATIVTNSKDKHSLNIQAQSSIGTDSNLNNNGPIPSDAFFGGDPNIVSDNLGMDHFHTGTGGDNSFNLQPGDPGFNSNQGANSFDQSSIFNLDGSISNKDTSKPSQLSGGADLHGMGLDHSFVAGAEEFAALMRNGGGTGEVGGHTVTDHTLDTTTGQRHGFSQFNGGHQSELLGGPNSGTTKSLIDQLMALNMANSMLESGPNINNGLGDLSMSNAQGSSIGLNENPMSADRISSFSFDNSIPTDPSMMNNAMLLADTRVLESPTSLPPRLVTETILLDTLDPLNIGSTSDRKVSVDITSGDASLGGLLSGDVSTGGTSSRRLTVDGISSEIPTGSLLRNLGVEAAMEKSMGLTNVVNSGIVGQGLVGVRPTVVGSIDSRLLGGSNDAFGLNTGGNTANFLGSTNILFDGSINASAPITRPVDASGSHIFIGSTRTSSQAEFGVNNVQGIPRIVHRPSNKQSAIETSINQILTISAAETAIKKAAKESNSQKETAAAIANIGGRFVSQTGLELSPVQSSRGGTLTQDVCQGCTMDGGLGYVRHPSRCDQFVVCYPDRSGHFKPQVQDCPYGQFWSNIDVTCKPSKDVNCENDYCKKLADRYQYSHSTNCVAYWQCQAGHSVMRCCPEGRTFVQGEGCVYSSVCADRCPVSSPLQFMWQVNCNKRPVPSDVTTYEKHLSTGWVSEKCSVGQIYEGEICDCIPADMGNPTYSFKGVCKPEVFLPFDTDFKDYSGSNTFVRTENVTLSNGAACFDGTSVISMPKFANMDFGKTVFMKIRYKQMDLKIDTEALLYNGDCEDIPTLVVGTKPSGNSFSVKTNTGAFQTSWVPSSVEPSDWRDVTITISGGRLEGGSGLNVRDIDVSGGIARSQCGIKLGWGKKFKSFVGCIDEVSIYRCIPNTRMAADGTTYTAITK